MTKTGIAIRALLGVREPALEECRARAERIERQVAGMMAAAKVPPAGRSA